MCDYVVVGAGLSGSIVARHLAEKDKKVLVLEKRNHIAGNIYDFIDDNGIRIQKYGPHAFHTNLSSVWEYISQFGEWENFCIECMVYMNERYTPSPFNFQTVDDFFSEEEANEIKEHLRMEYGKRDKVTIIEMLSSSDSVVKNFADFLFENDYSLYTAKQWGIKPNEIDVRVLKRVPVFLSYKTGYFDDRFQAIPKDGFTSVVENILKHENITVQLNTNAMDYLTLDDAKKFVLYNGVEVPIIWTGALDELFSYRYGKLPYRSLRFEWESLEEDSYQMAPVVAYPQADGFTRITEYKKLPVQDVVGKTTIAIEYPISVEENSDVEPYYPIPNEKNHNAYEKYRSEINQYHNVYLCGRLAEYKYCDMDSIINSALQLCQQL